MWQYNETPEFVDSAEKLKLSESVKNSLKSWAESANRVPTTRSKVIFRSPHNIFEIWTARMPDPDSNKGTRGGFRLAYFFNLTDESIHLDRIEHRSSLGSKKEHSGDMHKFTQYLNVLKKYLLAKLDSQ